MYNALLQKQRVIVVNTAVQGGRQRDTNHPEASHYGSEQDSLPLTSKASKVAK